MEIKWIALSIAIIYGALAISNIPYDIENEKTKQIAIEQGLVQDNKGHWIKEQINEKD